MWTYDNLYLDVIFEYLIIPYIVILIQNVVFYNPFTQVLSAAFLLYE